MARHRESKEVTHPHEHHGTIRTRPSRQTVPLARALPMIGHYAASRLGAQIEAVAFVVIYLFLSLAFVFHVPVQNTVSIVAGVAATVVGLAFFLEGLLIGIMPLGEQCGLRLPPKTGALGVAVFALVIGVTATLAEPAISFLKLQGSVVKCWDAPLLYLILNRGSGWLVFAVASGVGLAVVIGVFRFLYQWPFKPAVFVMIPVLVAAGFLFEKNPLLAPVAALAWDTGGATTGPVTVPLVIALGLGVSKISGNKSGGASGLGVVTLASGLPVAAVFVLALVLLPRVPAPTSAPGFFVTDPGVRTKALYVAGSEAALQALAQEAVQTGEISETDFSAAFPGAALPVIPAGGRELPYGEPAAHNAARLTGAQALGYLKSALQTVLPLALVLILTILLVIREKIRETDIALLGLVFTVTGMFLFGIGMESGISALGSQAGAALPHAYATTIRYDATVTLHGIDDTSLVTVPGEGTNEPVQYLWIPGARPGDSPRMVPYDPAYRNPDQSYTYIPVENAVFGRWGRYAGLAVVLAFVFVLGFGATLAEPSLSALGITVEELTMGTYKKATLISMVAIGVGCGMAVGFGRILFHWPLAWLLGAPYVLALLLTAVSSEEFAAIAWDSAGVTTGPITVPLVIAAGLGIGTESGGGAAFGVVATASVFPILAVLLSGIINTARAKNRMIH